MRDWIIGVEYNSIMNRISKIYVFNIENGIVTSYKEKEAYILMRSGRMPLGNAYPDSRGNIQFKTGSLRRYWKSIKLSGASSLFIYLNMVDCNMGIYGVIIPTIRGDILGAKFIRAPFDTLNSTLHCSAYKRIFLNAMVVGNNREGYRLSWLNSAFAPRNEASQNIHVFRDLDRFLEGDISENSNGIIIHNGRTHLGVWNIPEGVVEVRKFLGGANKIVFPKSLKYIGDYSFYSLDDLLEIEIPEGSMLRIIPKGAFQASNLSKIGSLNGIKYIKEDAFYGCSIQGDLTVTNLIYIGNRAFYQSHLSTVKLESILEIGVQAFAESYKLKEVYCGPNVDVIGKEAFMGCSNLRKVTINGLSTHIQKDAFCGCRNLETLAISPGIRIQHLNLPRNTRVVRLKMA